MVGPGLRRRAMRWMALASGVVVLAALGGYVLIPREDVWDFVWRQSRGTRFEQAVLRRALRNSHDPVERALADGRIRPGDTVAGITETFGPFDIVPVGRYHVIKAKPPQMGIAFSGWAIIARDGRAAAASAWSCTYTVGFFDTLSATERSECESESLYCADQRHRRVARRNAFIAAGGVGAIARLGEPTPDIAVNE